MLKQGLLLSTRILTSNFKRLRQPYKLTFAVTYRCNSKCKTCNIWKKKPTNELILREIKEIFRYINPSWVNLTGGEPFMREDLYEICKVIREETDTFLVNMITNGLLTKLVLKQVKRILKLKFPKLIVGVSLDGPQKLHDKLRGVQGNWRMAVELYKNLFKLNSSRFQTYFGYTISRHNVGRIEATLNDLKKEIRNITVNNIHFNLFHTSSIYYSNEGKEGQASKEKILKDIKFILKQKRSFGIVNQIDRRFIQLMPKYLNTGRSPLPCKALTSSVFIEPSSNVYPCTNFPLVLGNLRNESYNLLGIWNSRRATDALTKIKQGKCPHCWTACEAYQTMLGNLVRWY